MAASVKTSIKRPLKRTGARGLRRPRGRSSAKGAAGERGATGPPGPAGPAGPPLHKIDVLAMVEDHFGELRRELRQQLTRMEGVQEQLDQIHSVLKRLLDHEQRTT